MTFIKGIVAVGLLPTLIGIAQGIELPAGFVDESYIGGLDGQITGFDLQSDDRIFISEKSGIVRVVVDEQLQVEPFIDLREIVNDRVDRGLLSVAVHPQFPESPFVYVLFTFDPPELVTNNLTGAGALDGNGNRVARLHRYTADANQNFTVAIDGSERIILGANSTFDTIGNPVEVYDTLTPSCGPIGAPMEDCLPSDEITHTIGSLRFAADGSLYVTNGDGANYRSFTSLSQMTYDLNSLRGKILRIDAQTGLGLPNNPFYDGNPESNRSRVVGIGLRNPYSMTLHPANGDVYVGEVGDEFWEEINTGWGKNFGWPCYEGGTSGSLQKAGFADEPFCQELYRANTDVEAPLISWGHDGTGNAGILGDFYFGDVFPEQYTGKLFYGDFIKGWLRYADVSDPDNVTDTEFATNMLPMVEMRTGADGALYYASITSGEIRRIRYTGEGMSGETTPDDVNPDIAPDTDVSGGGETSGSGAPDNDPPQSSPSDIDSPENDTPENGLSDDQGSKQVAVGRISSWLILLTLLFMGRRSIALRTG